MKINVSQIWSALHCFLDLQPLSRCGPHCSLTDSSADETREEYVESKTKKIEMPPEKQEERKETDLFILQIPAPLIKRQKQGGKRGKHPPMTRFPEYTSVKTNLSGVIGLTSKLTRQVTSLELRIGLFQSVILRF